MSSITEILSTDAPKDSRSVINTNFGNLNTDKIEIATIDSATAKTTIADDVKIPVCDTGVLKTLSWAYVKSILKTYFDAIYTLANLGGLPTTYLDTDVNLAANSDTKIASQKAVKTYIDALPDATSLWTDNAGNITPDNITAGITCQLTDDGWWNVDRVQSVATGDQYGLGAGVIRANSGSNNIVAGVFHAHAQGTFTGSAWGLALEAWIGNHTTEGAAAANLIGCEVAVYGQYHANTGAILGFHAVFKDRPDGAADVIHAGVGTNKYNNLAEAFRVSSQARSSSGEYCGWNKVIRLETNALDRTTTESVATIIDFMDCTVDNSGGNPWILRWKDAAGSGGQAGIRYNTTTHYLEFYNGLDTTPTRRGYIDMLGSDHAL